MDYTNSRMMELISEYIHSDRDRQVLSLRLIHGHTFERIAEEVDMSTTQVKRIVYGLQPELFKHY